MSQTRFDASARPELHLAESFTAEQRATAEGIWFPLLRRLLPVLPRLTRLDCTLTPNGAVLESAEGWVMTLCCLEGQRLPHFIGVRRQDPEQGLASIKAFLSDSGYSLQPDPAADPTLLLLLRRCLHSLAARQVNGAGSSRLVRSPRLHQAS